MPPVPFWGWKNVVAFSGGRTSAYMLHLLLERHGDTLRKDWSVLFCNTGKEMNETLDFVQEVETRWKVPVVWLEYTRVGASEIDELIYPHSKSRKTIRDEREKGLKSHWFRVVDYATARRNNDGQAGPFDEMLSWAGVLPNVVTRSCSVQMKIRTMMRYLFSIGVTQWRDHIGIRADERHRTLEILANAPGYTKPQFPLCEAGVTEGDVMQFWSDGRQGFDLGLKQYEGNCDLCFMKAVWKRKKIMLEQPESSAWWVDKEAEFAARGTVTGKGKWFRGATRSYAKLLEEAKAENAASADDGEEDGDIACGCVDAAFKGCSVSDAAD
jgi:hypothetical protein